MAICWTMRDLVISPSHAHACRLYWPKHQCVQRTVVRAGKSIAIRQVHDRSNTRVMLERLGVNEAG